METLDRRRRVAIACQGGGSHTAFTAGVLKRLFGGEELRRHEVVGLSGTSGGAVCAVLAWYALLHNDPARAGRLLEEFWTDNSATAFLDRLLNYWTIWATKLENFFVTPAISPYQTAFPVIGLDAFRKMLERRVNFDEIEVEADSSLPMLLIGAVDVLSGDFKAFNSRRDRICADMILASAAIPTLFRSVRVDGRFYWDGLFSQNPPVRDLIDASPDEIWVIQINPKEREAEPKTVVEIADRRNELSGNLSLHQELYFIEKIDQMLEEGRLAREGKYKTIVVRSIELSRSGSSRSLGTASKLNRDASFIRGLVSLGEARAEEFLAALAFEDAWRSEDLDAVMSFFADDAELVSSPPFPDLGSCRGIGQLRPFVLEHLTGDIVVDLTKKQVAGERVAWTVRRHRNDPGKRVQGRAEAKFRGGKISTLRLEADTTARERASASGRET